MSEDDEYQNYVARVLRHRLSEYEGKENTEDLRAEVLRTLQEIIFEVEQKYKNTLIRDKSDHERILANAKKDIEDQTADLVFPYMNRKMKVTKVICDETNNPLCGSDGQIHVDIHGYVLNDPYDIEISWHNVK